MMSAFQTSLKILLLLAVGIIFVSAENYCQGGLPAYFPPNNNLKLKMVQVFTRHGDRTPASVLPFENVTYTCQAHEVMSVESSALESGGKYRQKVFISNNAFSQNIWKGNCKVGQLTDSGIAQHHVMGQTLRETYVQKFGFLDPTFDPKAIYVRSTDIWRTIQSAESNLLGLYPPENRAPETIIDINIDPLSVTDGYPNTVPCPRLDKLQQSIQNSDSWVKKEAALSKVLEKIRAATRTTGLSYWQESDRLADNLHCRVCSMLPLPCAGDVCVSEDDAKQLFKLTDWQSFAISNGTEVNKLAVGLLIQDAINLFESVIAQASGVKYAMYSGHDTTVAALLGALQIHDGFWPPYASNFILEFFEDKQQQHYVRVLYNGQVKRPPFCSDVFCPYKEFYTYLVNNIFIHDYQKDCF